MASQQAPKSPKPEHRKISQIKSSLLKPALTSHFEVFIVLPTFMKNDNTVQQDQLNLQCTEASLPGSSLATFEINNDHHGVTERHAYRRIFDERIDLTFYVDASNYLPIRTFESWIGGIVNGNSDEDKLINSNYYYTAKYPDDYRTDLYITKFERSYDSDIKYTFVKAFPISISAMPVSYDSSNLLKCTVGFTYLRYFTGASEGKPTPSVTQTSVSANPDTNTAVQDGSTNGQGTVATTRDSVTGQRMDGGSDGTLRYTNGQPVYDSSGKIQPMNT